MNLEQVRQFLREQSTLTLATVGPDGAPAAADLYFAADSALRLFFLSEPGARHARNIAHRPQVAATVHAPCWGWKEIRGLQIEGECQAVRELDQRAAALALYGRKFDFIRAFAAAITRHTVYQITPRWFRWLDNSVSFGYKQEWTP